MRLSTVFVFVLITTISFGQSSIIDNPKQRELIKNDFLNSLYRELTIDFQKIERTDLPIPYFMGEEFVLNKPIRIGEIINSDSSISFDIDKGLLVPAGYKLKLLGKKGFIYSIRIRDSHNRNERMEVISEKILKSYFNPNYESSRSQLFDNYKDIKDSLIKQISKKYDLTSDQVIGIIDYH